MKPKFSLFIPAIVWFVIATVLLVMPGPDIPSVSFLDKIYFDKWVHAGLFGGMTILFSYPFIKNFTLTKKLLIYIAIACALYGVTMEYVQKYFAFERDFDYYDMVADSVGCIIAYFVIMAFKRRLDKKHQTAI
ncbi:MAG TPA: VanZ family protein [Parafilimonas sp.]|nr:VanZ family protein [Parafilimonas sp.]